MSLITTNLKIQSPQNRLDFVLKNFFLSYSCLNNDTKIELDYGIRQKATLFCPDHFYKFTELTLDELTTSVHFLKVKNQDIPLFFCGKISEPSKIEKGKTIFQFDIISHIFFYLSGYQEIVNKERDSLNRFGYEHSIQKKLNIAHIPIVNYLYEILKSVFETNYNCEFKANYKPVNGFYTWITHDVDILQKINLKNIKYALKTAKISAVLNFFFRKKKLSHCFDVIENLQKKYNFESTYFFMTEKGKYKNFDNADYDISEKNIQKIINELKLKNTIGLHSSFGSAESESAFSSELSILQTQTHRSHFLMFDILKTPTILAKNNIKYDSSLGFYDCCGFRNGTSLPFYIYDFTEQKAIETIEIPLVVMDSTLFYAHYLNLKSKKETNNYLLPIIEQLQNVGGILTLNWHNHGFVEHKLTFWMNYFDTLIGELKSKKTVFIRF